MRLSVLLIFTTLFTMQAREVYGQGTKVSLQLKNVSISQFIDQLESTTDFRFVYKVKDVDLDRLITVKTKNEDITNVLNRIFSNTNTAFNFSNRLIYLVKRYEVPFSYNQAVIQNIVEGKVLDNNGMPLPGATVLEKGTGNGATTDFDGNFKIAVNGEAILQVSYVGFITKEVPVDNQSSINITLSSDNQKLDEVVLIGYGTNSKRNINGAIASIESDDIQTYSNAKNIDQALVGKLAGVNILTDARNPGDSNSIVIRGAGSITRDAEPLIVVDGYPLGEGSSLNLLNSNDIESVSVLKDAASASIYGSRAANGVIIITTKKGSGKKMSVQVSSVLGVQERVNSYDLLNAYDAAKFFRDARNNAYLKNHPTANINDSEEERLAKGANVRELILDYTIPYLNNEAGLTDFDWEDAVYRPGTIQNHYLNISGATEKTDYAVSIGYTGEEGIVITADQKRYTTNIKINTRVNDYLKYGININGYYSERGLTNGGNNYRFPIDPAGRAMVYMYPFFSAYDDSHSTGYNVEAQIIANRPYNANMQENPVAMAELSKYDRTEFKSFGNTYLAITPIKNLEFKTSLGYMFSTFYTDQFASMETGAYRELISERDTQQGSESRSDNSQILIENTLDYTFDINKHSFGVLLGQSFQKSYSTSLSVVGDNFPNDIIDNINGSTTQTASASRSRWTQLSYFGRLMYDYDNTYFLTASLRRDGSSKFGIDNRYGTFASFSAGWVLSNEDFFPKNDVLTYSKLRYSWGETGNNQIGNYSQYATIGTGADYPFDGTLYPGAAPTSSPSYGLGWETNTSNNFGLDLGFFNTINLGANYYIANISDLLLDRPVPEHTGFNTSLQNIGEMQNRGWEFEINTSQIKLGDLNVALNANLTTNENEIISLGGVDELYEGGNQRFISRVGGSLANLYGYKIIGLLKSQEEVDEYNNKKSTTLTAEIGDYIFQDTDNNDIINADDRVELGDYKPEVTYGFGINLDYKGFDLSMSFNGTMGRVAYDLMTSNYLEYGEAFSNTDYYYYNNYWDPINNPEGFLAPPDAYGNTSTRAASRNPTNYNVLDADYLRLRSMQIGYSFPSALLDQVYIDNLRVFVSGTNLYTWTKYRGMNPDGGSSGNPLSSGYVEGTTSIPRVISVGINLSF
ncbi:hypothetical protein APS56_06245 [Pseudalgibacter alginicilyticus]|uniref:SusC/RagA family TonB-linked outer membrane protein n=2 Tax=Pseudalgibacter alginicilyticus TaxID=1736674 RepID=A0A0N7HYB0_9FLAO|nr:hypothetical protein APS56_06245 [Pseudalgibacter alginicilyticus]